MFKFLRIKKMKNIPIIGRGLIINGSFKENIHIGKNAVIGRYARLGNTLGQKEGIVISDDCCIGNNFTAIDGDIYLGKHCLLASNVSIFAANHNMDPTLPKCYSNEKMVFAPVKIGDDCWIGQNVVILPGVEIGEKCIIGAGAVVTKSMEAYSLAVGNPARVIKKFNLETKKWESVK